LVFGLERETFAKVAAAFPLDGATDPIAELSDPTLADPEKLQSIGQIGRQRLAPERAGPASSLCSITD
jgi:hypothetical protein